MRIPICGIGVIAPGAIGVEAFRALLKSDRPAWSEVDRFDTTGLRARCAALVKDFQPKAFIHPMKMRRMNTLSRFAVAAAKLAIADADVELPQGTGVALGTSFGPVQTSVEYMQEYVEKGAALAPPQLFAESVANAAGSHVAIEWGLRGFNITVTQRESSALAAAMYASSQIVKATVPAALTGGVEEVNEMIFSVLDRIGALASYAPHPFGRNRDGILLGEGSAILILGTGAKRYASFAGFGMARDTTASLSDWGEQPEAIVRAMNAAIDDAELTAGDIDAIYASANGSKRGDAVEARAIASLFGDRVPVVTTKGLFGEYAAGGVLQVVAAILGVSDQELPPSVGADDPVIPVAKPGPRELRNVLVNSVSAGGGMISAVVSA
jgi:3-oxoacyl-[acyl-carrier-protein] synthase II